MAAAFQLPAEHTNNNNIIQDPVQTLGWRGMIADAVQVRSPPLQHYAPHRRGRESALTISTPSPWPSDREVLVSVAARTSSGGGDKVGPGPPSWSRGHLCGN